MELSKTFVESTQAMLKSSTKSGGGTKSSTKHTTKPPPTTKSGTHFVYSALTKLQSF